jgi:hypothetical protein
VATADIEQTEDDGGRRIINVSGKTPSQADEQQIPMTGREPVQPPVNSEL